MAAALARLLRLWSRLTNEAAARRQPVTPIRARTQDLEELADEIHCLFIRLEDAGAPDQVEAKTARAFATHYQTYLDLGGKPFETTKNWLWDLVTLEQRCRDSRYQATQRR